MAVPAIPLKLSSHRCERRYLTSVRIVIRRGYSLIGSFIAYSRTIPKIRGLCPVKVKLGGVEAGGTCEIGASSTSDSHGDRYQLSPMSNSYFVDNLAQLCDPIFQNVSSEASWRYPSGHTMLVGCSRHSSGAASEWLNPKSAL
jgi:hypothetical protein